MSLDPLNLIYTLPFIFPLLCMSIIIIYNICVNKESVINEIIELDSISIDSSINSDTNTIDNNKII